MNARQILENYQKVQKALPSKFKNLEIETVDLERKTTVYASMEEVLLALDRFQGQQGWVGFQSQNVYFRQGLMSIEPKYGVILNAEMVNSHQVSLHIRYDGNGNWIATSYYATPGNEFVADEVKHLATDEKLGSLRYRRFWHLDAQQGMEPFSACFIGFGGR